MATCPFCKNQYDTGADLQEHLDKKHPDETTDLGDVRKIQPKKFKKVEKKQIIVVDGDDIAKVASKPAKAMNLKKVRAILQKQGYAAEIFVSTKLKDEIDDPFELQRLINLKWVIEIDENIIHKSMLETAQEHHCEIVSNFAFAKFQKEYSGEWNLKKKLKNYDFNDGNFQLVN